MCTVCKAIKKLHNIFVAPSQNMTIIFIFLSNVRNFINQNETKLETSKSEYTGMYNIMKKIKGNMLL